MTGPDFTPGAIRGIAEHVREAAELLLPLAAGFDRLADAVESGRQADMMSALCQVGPLVEQVNEHVATLQDRCVRTMCAPAARRPTAN